MKEQNFQEEVMKILEEIPKARSALVDNYDNLLNVAEYCNSNYIQSGDGSMMALEETKNFTTQSLASVAYQISTLASSILSLLDAQTNQLGHMESSINLIGQKVEMHKEKVSRREIGIFTAVRRVPRTHNILPPAAPQPRPPYSRRPINYKQLDGVGHSMKVSGKQLDRPGTLRKHGASIRSCKPTESVQCPVAPPVISSSFGKPVAPPTIPTTGLAPLECDIITTLLDEAPPPLTAAEISTQNVKVANTSSLPPPLTPPASSGELMAPPLPPLLPASSEEMVALLPPPPASSGEMVAPPPPPPLVASPREMVTPPLPLTVSSGELVVLPPPPAPPASSGEMMAPPPPPLLPASSGEMVAPPPLLPASSGEMMAPTPPPPPLSLQLNGLTNHSCPLPAPPLFLETVVEENSFPSPSPPPPPSDEATLTVLTNEGSEIPTLPPPPNQEVDVALLSKMSCRRCSPSAAHSLSLRIRSGPASRCCYTRSLFLPAVQSLMIPPPPPYPPPHAPACSSPSLSPRLCVPARLEHLDLEILAPPPPFLMDDKEGFDDIMPPLPPPVEYDTDAPPKYLDKVVALYNYEASRPDDLSITEGDIIYLMHRHSDGWCEGILHGNKGFFPENYVQSCSSVVALPTHKSHANEKN